ncbi:FAD-dependent oxidoreductase [Saccharospirillum alexandrii]|uniref:FAD-dependent oxidoreductase n=1 Tax=Saccharospirillum alexandrii TaxID=2448477 RepID=UPI003736DD17
MSAVHTGAESTDFDFSMPLVIVGAGACGLVAALAAREAGIELVVLERDAFPRGSTSMSSGFVPAAGTRFQTAAGVIDSAEVMARDIQKKNGNEADPAIVNTLAEQSASIIEWLADRHNIPFELVQGFLYPGHSAERMHCTPRRTGEELMGALLTAAENAGIDIITDALVTDLYANTDGRITGLTYEQPDGSRETLGCDTLLLACNGYGGNQSLVKQYLPQMEHALYYGHEGNQGDALRWGEQLGASLKDLGAFQGHGSLADPPQTLVSWAVMMQGGIQINIHGQRFSNEHGGYSEQAAKVLSQPTQYAWNVYDDRIHDYLTRFEDYQNAMTTRSVKTFESLEDMARELDMELAVLQATFSEMASLAESGQSDRFGRTFAAQDLLKPPYFAIRVTGALFHTQGGLEITPDGRVLDETGGVLPNLLAAGGAARGVSGSNDTGYLSGNGLLHAIVMGGIAGRTAAAMLADPR